MRPLLGVNSRTCLDQPLHQSKVPSSRKAAGATHPCLPGSRPFPSIRSTVTASYFCYSVSKDREGCLLERMVGWILYSPGTIDCNNHPESGWDARRGLGKGFFNVPWSLPECDLSTAGSFRNKAEVLLRLSWEWGLWSICGLSMTITIENIRSLSAT